MKSSHYVNFSHYRQTAKHGTMLEFSTVGRIKLSYSHFSCWQALNALRF